MWTVVQLTLQKRTGWCALLLQWAKNTAHYCPLHNSPIVQMQKCTSCALQSIVRLPQFAGSPPNLTWSRILSSKCWEFRDIHDKNAVNWFVYIQTLFLAFLQPKCRVLWFFSFPHLDNLLEPSSRKQHTDKWIHLFSHQQSLVFSFLSLLIENHWGLRIEDWGLRTVDWELRTVWFTGLFKLSHPVLYYFIPITSVTSSYGTWG